LILQFFNICFIFPLICAVGIYVNHSTRLLAMFGARSLFHVDAGFFFHFLRTQGAMAFILTELVGPGLVSPDLANGAFDLKGSFYVAWIEISGGGGNTERGLESGDAGNAVYFTRLDLNAQGAIVPLGHDVQAPVHAIGEVDVGMTGGTVENLVAGRAPPPGGVARRVVRPDVGLRLHDGAAARPPGRDTHQPMAEQLRGHGLGSWLVERPGQRSTGASPASE
jgi:hypothetical protein